MPQINNIANLEKKSNRVNSAVTGIESTWTDTQLATAGALKNIHKDINQRIANIHPIGSVLCMSTNTNPGSLIGGSWTLIDKSFAHKIITLSASDWTASNATFSAGSIILYGKEVVISLSLIPGTLSDSTITLGTLKLANHGIDTLCFTVSRKKEQCDGGANTMVINASNTGVYTCYDSLNWQTGDHTNREPGQHAFVSNTYNSLLPADMPDQYCNKFYFKRTA